MGVYVALCSLAILTTWQCWLARRVAQLSRLASVATKREQAPARWASQLAELRTEVLSLSSSFEKASKLMQRQNSRTAMRELREEDDLVDQANRKNGKHQDDDPPPPPGAPKSELRAWAKRQGHKITV